MNAIFRTARSVRPRASTVILGVLAFMLFPSAAQVAHAHGPFGFGFMEQIRNVKDPATARQLNLKLGQTAGSDIWSGSCAICHLGGRGGTPRNVFGNAMNTFLSYADYYTPARISEAGRRVMDIPANPSLPDSPTFGELINAGELPIPIFSRTVPTVRRKGPAPAPERVTVEDARNLVEQVEAESRFGILQLSRTDEISPEVAAVLAEFRGEFLILGIRSLTPEVAAALANSQAANVWLHNITSVPPAVADAIVKLRGHLVLTGLAELTSPALAEKLAKRPGALSFPYVKEITLPVASALVQHEGSLTLGGLTAPSPELQDKLAEAKFINLPSLKSLDSKALTERLAENWRLFLPDVDRLTVEQAKLFANTKGQKFVSAAAMTDEVAGLFSQSMNATSIVLFGDAPISDAAFESLLTTRFAGLELRDVEVAPPGLIKVMTEVKRAAFLPQLKRLDSVPLANTFAGAGTFPSVTYISNEVADSLGKLPEGPQKERDGTMFRIPANGLSFPILEDLPPETSRRLLQRRWTSLSFPALQDYSIETTRLMTRQTESSLTLGLSSLPPELAAAFAEAPLNPVGSDRWFIFPFLTDLSPESAGILVKALNRGVQQVGNIRMTKTPQLFLGGQFGSAATGLSRLTPELATELARYEGILAISGLRELTPESAAPLATFPGPILRLSGPGTQVLAPETAAALARIPGRLLLEELKVIDSIPLCDKNTRDFGWYWHRAETVAPDTVNALIQFRQWFNLDGLTELESPALARRLIEPPLTGGRNLHALQRLAPEAAEVIATCDKPVRLGLRVLDDAAVARALSRSKGKIGLMRLQAATPEVIEILKDSAAFDTPNLESLYVLTERKK